jgi:uncharacterized membrane protein
MNEFIKIYLLLLVLFIIIDALWLGLIARGFYKSALATTMREKPLWLAAAAFYILYPLGLWIFAVHVPLKNFNWLQAAERGALFGFMAYATYNLSNLATLKTFPLRLALTDMAWGTVLSGAVCGTAVLVMRVLA